MYTVGTFIQWTTAPPPRARKKGDPIPCAGVSKTAREEGTVSTGGRDLSFLFKTRDPQEALLH